MLGRCSGDSSVRDERVRASSLGQWVRRGEERCGELWERVPGPAARTGLPSAFSSSGAQLRHMLVAQMVKCLPAMQETWVLSLGWEDPLEKEMATHSSTLAWKIPWMEEPGRL